MNVFLMGRKRNGVNVPIEVDDFGSLVQGHQQNTFTYAGIAGGIVDTADDEVAAAPGAGNANYVTSVQISNKHATTGTEVVLKSGASTVIWRGYAPPAGVQISAHFTQPLVCTANEALNVACVTTATATIVNVQGYVDTV